MPESPLPPPVTMLLSTAGIRVWGFSHRLGRVQRSLSELKSAGLLCNEEGEIARQGYARNYGAAHDETLVDLASGPFRSLLGKCPNPQALVFHHSYGESAVLGAGDPEGGFMPHAQYFPAAMLRAFDLDHVPYLGSFASGCTGLFSMMITAAGLLAFSRRDPVVCLTADIKPAGTTYDALRERILTSDCCSGFLMGHENRGYQVLGISYYSTKRELVPLVEIVKRTVLMVRGLTEALSIDCAQHEWVLHYPNIFAGAWKMVTEYLKITREPAELDEISDRAHCLSSDPVITLGKRHRGQAGRLHVVVNFGSGLHLAVGVFREEALE